MKKKTLPYLILLAGLLLLVLWDCRKKAELAATYPNVSFDEISQITSFSVNARGNVLFDGGATVTDKGFCWGMNQNPTIYNDKISIGTGTGSFSCSLSGLISGTTYNLRAYAINAKGTAYSKQVSFTTVAFATVVTTVDNTSISSTKATVGGTITSIDETDITGRGVCWNTMGNPTIADSKTTVGTGAGTFTSNLAGLTPNNKYYVKAYATNGNWTIYGKQLTFRTTAISAVPVLTTSAVTEITLTTATGGGNVMEDGGSAIVARGVCWATSKDPTTANSKTIDGTGTGSFTSNITGLTENTVYYIRAYATNRDTTCYGNNVFIRTLSGNYAIVFNPNLTYGTVTDIDGNVYKTIKIGTQTWMAENLKTTRYRNGDLVTDIKLYETQTRLCAMYTGVAATDSRNLAPTGWHVPSDAEWRIMYTFLGSGSGLSMREVGTTHWLTDIGTTNSSGFTALPDKSDDYAGWWTSSIRNNDPKQRGTFWCFYDFWVNLAYSEGSLNILFSVRCVQD